MSHFLQQIVIIGHDNVRRTLNKFDAGVNIISGRGSKGLSSIAHIFEYCVGAPRCRIPTGKVREFAAWYFLVLQVRDERIIIGRRAPANIDVVSADAYFDRGVNPTIPIKIESNMLIHTACGFLAESLGIPASAMLLGTKRLEYGRIAISDLLPFLVQPQGIICSNELFERVDTRNQREQRDEVFNIALGLTSAALLKLRAKREQLIEEKNRVVKRQAKSEKLFRDTLQGFQSLWQKGVAVGLLPDKRIESVDEVKDALGRVQQNPAPTEADIAAGHQQLMNARARSDELRHQIRSLSADLDRCLEIKQAAEKADSALGTEAARMRMVDLLGTPTEEKWPCPVCGTCIGPEIEGRIRQMQTKLDDDIHYVRSIPPELTATERTLRNQLEEQNRKLKIVDAEIRELQARLKVPTLTQERIQHERLIGAFEDRLTRAAHMKSPRSNDEELDTINRELAELEKQLASDEFDRIKREIISRINERLMFWASELEGLDLSEGRLRFSGDFSTIARIQDDRSEPLAVLGGAGQLVRYHLVAMLALHEQLLRNHFIPPIVFFDQPSQPFFPSDNDPAKTDVNAVRALYRLLFKFAEITENRVQVVVLDHADFSNDDPRFDAAMKYEWHQEEDGLIE